MLKIINFAAFQAGWFACVLGAAHGHAWAGTAAVGAVLALHLWLSGDWQGELVLALLAAAVGLVLETVLVATGAAAYASPAPIASLPPGWIIAMWVLLATALNSSLSWMRGRLLLAAVLGAVAAPLSYSGGAGFGGMVLGQPLWQSLVLIGVLWAVAMPILVWAATLIANRKPTATLQSASQ